MSTTQFLIDMSGISPLKMSVKELEKRQKKRRQKVTDLKIPMAKVSIFLDSWVQRNFKTEGGSVGDWLGFSTTGRWIPGKGWDLDAKLLQDTGRLRASFKPFATKKDAGVFSDLPYSKHHEKGEGNLPVRRMLPKRKEVIDDAKKILSTHTKEAIEK